MRKHFIVLGLLVCFASQAFSKDKTIINQLIQQYDLELPGVEIIDPTKKEQLDLVYWKIW